MSEQDKVTVDDVISIIKTEEQIDGVEEVRKLRGRENKTAKRCTLIHGDCLVEMDKLIDDGVRVDMILTDPPYLMNYHTGWIKDKTHDFRTPIANDTNFELIADVMPLLYRLLKMGGGILYVLQ